MIFLIIILISIGVAVATANFTVGDLLNGAFWAISTVISIVIFFIIINEPKPIDVYRNKTTLEITYRNGVAIDSTVVFKNAQ